MIKLRLYGPFLATWADGTPINLGSAKLRAMLALLITSPTNLRTRVFLQDMLWARSGSFHGRGSLRAALSSLRRSLGDAADDILVAENDQIGLRAGAVDLVGSPSDGAFLEGIDIAENSFEDWLRDQRLNTSLPIYMPSTIDLRATVAVIPLADLSDSEQGAVLGDLLAQEVTRSLSRSTLLDVISHLSSRNITTRSGVLSDMQSQLNCDYLTTGNFRLHGGTISINLDLLNARSGKLLWTRSFSERIDRLLSGESEVPYQVAIGISQSIARSSIEATIGKPIQKVETHDLLMSGITMMHRQSFGRYSRARTLLEEVTHRIPERAEPYAWLAKWYGLNLSQGWSTKRKEDAQTASDFSKQALDLDPDCSFSLTIAGYVHNNILQEFDESEALFERALLLDPNNALAWLMRGALDAFTDNGAKAVEHCQRARKLSPLDPQNYFFHTLAATAALSNRDYEGALSLADESLQANDRHISTHRVRIIALERLGRHEEAMLAANRLMQRDKTFTVRAYLDKHPAANFSTGREWADALSAAGIH